MAPPKGRKRSSTASSSNSSALGIQPVVDLPELNLFLRKELQVQVQEINEESILPTGIFTEGSDVVFNIKGDVERFLDPSSIRLVIQAQLRNGDGSAIVAATQAAPIANMAMSLFSRVNVILGNSTSITSNADTYPYVAYLDNLLRKSAEHRDQFNFVSFIWPDTYGKFDLATDENTGYKQRKEQSKNSQNINMICSIVSPITNQNRLILPLVDMSFVLHPATSKFLVRSDVAPVEQRTQKIVITDISMQYRKIRLNTGLHLTIMGAIQRAPAVYPVKWLKTYEFQKNLGLRTIREVVFSDNILPSTVYLFGVSTDRRVGSYTTSPWLINFSNLTDVRLVSGTDSFPRIPFDPAVRMQYRMYLEAKKCLGSFLPGQDNGINYTTYIDGYGIIAWDLSRSGNPHLPDMPRLANLELHMDYSEGLTEATSYILVMEYNSNIYVKSNIEVTTEFIA